MNAARRPSSLLFPRPRILRVLTGRTQLEAVLALEAPQGLDLSSVVGVAWLARALRARQHSIECGSLPGDAACSILQLQQAPGDGLAGTRAQGYSLRVEPHQISLSYTTLPGLQHGLATLAQLVTLADGEPGHIVLENLAIEDWPDFDQRGAMLDISRDKVPTMATLLELVDQLASWKLNQLQLYMEHAFAYAGHEVVWKDASPLTAAEVRELDAHCAARHIELVPNQNSFGHMHRWLIHERYRPLAECPDGFVHPWNWTGKPYGLCATDPETLRFLEGLYDQLLPHFSSAQFNVGLDETLDLGHGRSKAACDARGTERVYLEFLGQVHRRLRARGKVMQFWADIIVKRPELLAELPEDGVVLEWGYEAAHPFAERVAAIERIGLRFFVCPGTSSWNSIAGRSDNALENIANAARAGKAAHAAGLLVTDWGDHGHLQPLAVSYLGLFAAAGFSWNVADAETPLALDLPERLDRLVFYDPAGELGRAAYDLGNTYREAGSLRHNSSVLFWILIKPERLFTPAGVTRESLERALEHLDQAGARLARARPREPGCSAVHEFAWARDLLSWACRLGIARTKLRDCENVALLPSGIRRALRQELGELIERHRALWLQRNRAGGLPDSTGRLSALRDTL